ncbi:tetratricopeptide repeat protein [Desulfonatronovibrio magnus]|uniref:tetratricopeptide repeat protein n=1 Tax=Desulfonatronovibrio magnus TaxID=698827 RepID=UPI0005EAD4E2|nr:tetratricopeptide repeat protein [Desulfonatronovibrio magnus]RQD62537.1 MAG: tetratricopeptide repeat protein [Desulfonatronovibrio sp. MSAO_Bac4]
MSTNPEQDILKDLEDDKTLITGVFSSQSLVKVGTGTTQKKTIQKTYWFVKELEDDQVEIQPLNINYVPSGPKSIISKDDLLEKFSPEPEYYTYTVYPKMRELNKTIARADRHRQKGESFSAEFEYNNALKVDEENIRANFGLGLTYLERGDKDKANNIFERLVKLDAAFEKEHKHLFNDFGINLRKQEMYAQALEYYQRALQLVENDENLHYNVARAYFAFKKYPKTLEHLKKALQLNPDFQEAIKFVKYLKQKKLVK